MSENYTQYTDTEYHYEHLNREILVRLRGRPDDPKNKAISIAKKSLAQTIQVNPLSPFVRSQEPSELEVARSRHHYNEFKKCYALKHSTACLRPQGSKMPIIREASNLDMYRLDPLVAPSKPELKMVDKKSFTERPQTKDQHVNVPSWTTDGEAQYNRYPDDVQALLLLQKLKDIESNFLKISKTSQCSQVSSTSQNAATQSILEQAEKEASVAQDQLEAIQRLLKVDKATSRPSVGLSTIDEEEELHPKTKQKKIVDNVKEKISKAKQKNMVMTLNNLNQRIQQMHDKYFNAPRYNYLSLKDVKRRAKFEKNIETLYRNEGFDPEKEISDILLEHSDKTLSSAKTSIIDDKVPADVIQGTKPVSIVRKSVSTPMEQHEITADISSDNYLQNRRVKHGFIKFMDALESNQPEKSTKDQQEERSARSSLAIGFSDASNDASNNTAASPSKYKSAEFDVILSPKTSTNKSNSITASASVDSKSSGTLHSIQDSILKSEFLMKEFNLTESDISMGLSNYESSISMSAKCSKSQPSFPSIQEFFSATSQKSTDRTLDTTFMEDSMRVQLKNSLYDIF